MEHIAHFSVANQHPRFFSALRWGADIHGIVGEWLTSVMSTTMYTYEIAPLFTLMEEYIFEKIAWLVGWEKHVGMLLPGWAHSNMYGLQFARYALDTTIHTSWLYWKQRLIVFTSDQSHYSISKSALLMWLWTDNVINIPTNNIWEMIPEELELAIINTKQKWHIPYFINATSGTTVLWAFDPLEKIADIAKKYNIWLHVDAVWWGWVLLHNTLSKKVKGIERADSFAWNPHKMMWTPLQCSIFMTKHTEIAKQANTLQSAYLFNEDKMYDTTYDTWDRYIQCGRKVDIVKLWLQRKALGDTALANNIEWAFEKAAYLTQRIHESKYLYLVQEPDCLNVCFWYLPWTLDKKTLTRENILEHKDDIHRLTATIYSKILQAWEMMTMYTHTKWLPNFFRMVTTSNNITLEDLDFVVEHIETLWQEIEKIWYSNN
jgi:glutamate/tyrosine decarboxylase-like PLP-dependent enzyme